jgi:lipopolysaccharide export system protein LptA
LRTSRSPLWNQRRSDSRQNRTTPNTTAAAADNNAYRVANLFYDFLGNAVIRNNTYFIKSLDKKLKNKTRTILVANEGLSSDLI